jgi:hypothetical protein
MGSSFLTKKKQLIDTILDVESIFKDGLTIKTNIEQDNITMKEITYDEVKAPTLLLSTIDKLPEEIYEFYSKDKIPKIPFDELEPQEQYSNIRQAKSISKNLTMIGCELALESTNRNKYKLNDDEISDLARFEHKDWCKEKINTGWSPGAPRDNENLIHPSLVEWNELEPTVQDQNKETIKNIPKILSNIGLKIVVNNIRLLTVALHNYYNEVNNIKDNPFENLSDEDKYFNYKQTEIMVDFLKENGYDIVPESSEGTAILELDEELVESLAKKEHESWCDYKQNLGWTRGEKSEETLTNPNICTWNELKKEVREYNKNTFKNMPALCSNEGVNLKIITKTP